MAWVIPLVSIATSLLSRQADAKRARAAQLGEAEQSIYDKLAASHGGNPYSGDVGRYAVGSQQLTSQLKNRTSDLGTALQAYAGLTGKDGPFASSGSSSSTPSTDVGPLIDGSSVELSKPSLLADEPDPYALDSRKYRL
jgi:hypothetical protein